MPASTRRTFDLSCRIWDRRFKEKIVPVTVSSRRGALVVDTDEHLRDVTVEGLPGLRPVRLKPDSEATVTACNASGPNDGAVYLVTTPERADQLGTRPLVRSVTWAAGVEPSRMVNGTAPWTAAAVARTDLTLAGLDLIGLIKVFAAQAFAWITAWGLRESDFERVNVIGSGISRASRWATCFRILTTMPRGLDRREGRYALETMCIGCGRGLTAVVERVA
jgi:acetyl-CoA C-acetyltransferase